MDIAHLKIKHGLASYRDLIYEFCVRSIKLHRQLNKCELSKPKFSDSPTSPKPQLLLILAPHTHKLNGSL